MRVVVQLEPHAAAPPEVDYTWDPDTDILSAQLRPRPHGDGMSGSVGIEGRDGSWVILDLAAGRINGVEIAVWPDVQTRPALAPPTKIEDFSVVVPTRTSQPNVASLEMDTRVIAETDAAERTFHFKVGKPRESRTVRVARDLLFDVDEQGGLTGLWLLNVPPVPERNVITTIVLIRVDPSLIPAAANMLAGVEGVAEVYSVSGDWDLVAIVRVPQYDQIAHVVTEVFPTVPGIQRTQTLTAFRAYSKKDLQQAWDIGVE